MRPTPDEIIASARTLLRQEVAPGLSPEGAVNLKRVMAALRDGRWNDTGFDLLNENDALAALIGDCLRDGASTLPAALSTTLQTAVQDHATARRPRSFAEANDRNAALRAALAALIDAMKGGAVSTDHAIGTAIASTLLALQQSRAR